MIVPDKAIDLLATEGIDPDLTTATTGWSSAVWEAGETSTITATPDGGRIQASGLYDSTSGHGYDYVIASEFITPKPSATYRVSFRYKRLAGGTPEVWLSGVMADLEALGAATGTWATFTHEFTAPSLNPPAWRFLLYHSLGVSSLDFIVTDFQVWEVRGFEALRLEVGLDPAGLTNLIQNGSGEQGGYGWVTPVPGTVLVGETSGWTAHRQGLRFTTAADPGGNYFYTEPLAVAAGEWARAKWHVNYTPYNAYRVRIDWLDSGGNQIGSSAWTNFTEDYTDHSIAAVQAPAGTSYARLRFEVGGGGVAGTYPYVYQGSNFTFRDAVVAKAATSGELADPMGTVEAIDWFDVLGPTHEIQVAREGLNLGTLTATILDATLDPAVADTIRPGRPVRLTGWNDSTAQFEPLFTGQVAAAQVQYDTRRLLANPGDPKHARIILEATDATQALAAANRPEGVATTPDLPYVLEGAGVPWVVNGDSNQVANANVVALNESASALDQVAVTRDSELGYAWVDRHGVLQAWSTLPDPTAELIQNGDFAADVSGWSPFAATLTRDTSRFSSSPASMKVTATGAVALAHADTIPWVKVAPTITYNLSAKALANTAARTISFYVNWHDQDGAYIRSSREDQDYAEEVDATAGWTTLNRTVTAPPGAYAAVVVIGARNVAAGEVHWFDAITMKAVADVPVLDGAAYSDVDVSFDTDACINEVTVKYLLLEAGGTQEVQYGPYVDTASVAEWGRHSSEFTVQGIPQDAASIQAYANQVLAANAVPGVRVRSMRVPIRDQRDLTSAKAFLDLYDLANVVYDAKGINEHSRIVGLTHTITPDGWLLDVSFTPQGAVAAPLVTPSPSGRIDPVGSGPASVPVGGVQPYAGSTAPFGWLLCNGQSVPVADYPTLHAVIGYTYGGSGATFKVPDFRDRFPIGAGSKALGAAGGSATKTLSIANMPAHNHGEGGAHYHELRKGSGTGTNNSTLSPGNALANTDTGGMAVNGQPTSAHTHATQGSSDPFDVMNPWRAINFIIKV